MTRKQIKLVQEVAEVLSVPYKIRAYTGAGGLGFKFGAGNDPALMTDDYGEAMLQVIAADAENRADKPPVG